MRKTVQVAGCQQAATKQGTDLTLGYREGDGIVETPEVGGASIDSVAGVKPNSEREEGVVPASERTVQVVSCEIFTSGQGIDPTLESSEVCVFEGGPEEEAERELVGAQECLLTDYMGGFAQDRAAAPASVYPGTQPARENCVTDLLDGSSHTTDLLGTERGVTEDIPIQVPLLQNSVPDVFVETNSISLGQDGNPTKDLSVSENANDPPEKGEEEAVSVRYSKQLRKRC
ncbi:unnamed protein product [Caretta caretta]